MHGKKTNPKVCFCKNGLRIKSLLDFVFAIWKLGEKSVFINKSLAISGPVVTFLRLSTS